MQKNPILNYRQFRGIFEEDATTGESIQTKSIDVVMNIFFQIYGTIVTKTKGYKDAVQDYQAISDADNAKRGELMVSTINKISDLALEKNPYLQKPIEEFKKSMDFLKQAYDKILAEDKGQLLNIKKKIKDMIISYLQDLISTVKNTEIPEEAKNESLEYFSDLLLEKDLYYKERRKVIKTILPLKAKAESLSNKSIFPEIKNSAKSALKKYNDIIKNLQSDNFFDSKKRTERVEQIDNFRFNATEIEKNLNSDLSQITIKYGIAKEIDGLIKKSLESLNLGNTALQDAEKKKSVELEKKKIEEEKSKKEGEEKEVKEKEVKEIKEGDKNPEAIKSIKNEMNKILPDFLKLEDNGDYDKKLKEAIEKSVVLMKTLSIVGPDYKTDTSKITVDFQNNLQKYIKEIEKIRK